LASATAATQVLIAEREDNMGELIQLFRKNKPTKMVKCKSSLDEHIAQAIIDMDRFRSVVEGSVLIGAYDKTEMKRRKRIRDRPTE
jgi:hypothetical protein